MKTLEGFKKQTEHLKEEKKKDRVLIVVRAAIGSQQAVFFCVQHESVGRHTFVLFYFVLLLFTERQEMTQTGMGGTLLTLSQTSTFVSLGFIL